MNRPNISLERQSLDKINEQESRSSNKVRQPHKMGKQITRHREEYIKVMQKIGRNGKSSSKIHLILKAVPDVVNVSFRTKLNNIFGFQKCRLRQCAITKIFISRKAHRRSPNRNCWSQGPRRNNASTKAFAKGKVLRNTKNISKNKMSQSQ